MDNEAHEVIATRLECGLDGPEWAHAPLMSMIQDLSLAHATWRPEGRRCIWDYVRHMLMWRQFVAARLEGQTLGEPADEWPSASGLDESQMAADLAALRETNARIVAALRSMPAETRHPSDARWPAWISVLGVLQHDSFHAGQIALLRGLQGV